MKTKIFLLSIISSFIISCSSSQSGSPFGDYKSSTCTGDNCISGDTTPEPSFERDDNSDIIVSKFDNTIELSGKCRLKDFTDSEIVIQVTSESGEKTTLTDGYVPLVGITSSATRVAKCEKGRWGIAINACNNLMDAAGAHRLDLTLRGKDKGKNAVEISDGKISMNLIRSLACDASVL